MRRLAIITIITAGAALIGSQAAAQGATGNSMGDIYSAQAVVQARAAATSMSAPDSPFSKLSKDSRAWIFAECKRQAETPRTAAEVMVSIDAALEDDLSELSRRQRIDPHDIGLSVLMLIMADAEDAASKAARKARKAGDPTTAAAAAERLAQAVANRKEAFAMQSEVSLALAMM